MHVLQPATGLIICQAALADSTCRAPAGVDDADSYDQLCSFVQTVSQQSGVRHFVVHARKCILHGLSPAQNRTVPKLK